MDKWIGIRSTLLQAVALLDADPSPEVLEKQHAAAVKKLTNYHDARRAIPHGAKEKLTELKQHYNFTNLTKSLKFLNYILEKNDDLLCGVLSSASSLA